MTAGDRGDRARSGAEGPAARRADRPLPLGGSLPPAGARSLGGPLALLGLLALVLALTLPTLGRVTYAAELDEGAYLAAVRRVHADGIGVLPELFREYVAASERHIFPSPLRFGHALVASGWCALFGASFRALSWLSLACHLALVAIVWAMTRRAKGELAAFAVAALVACSSLGLGLARRALLDPHATLWLVLAAWAFLEALASPGARGPSSRTRWSALFALAFTLAVLVREASVLWLAPLALVYACERALGRTTWSAGAALATLAAPAVLAGGAFALAAGGVEPLLDTVRTVLASLATNDYARTQMAGPWFRYVVDLTLLSPGIALPALLAAGALAASPSRARAERDFERRWLVLALGALVAFAFVEKNARYALALYVPAAIGAWSSIEGCATWIGGRLGAGRARLLALALVALVAASEVRSYRYLFVQRGLYDPVTSALVRMRGLFRGPRDL